MANRQPQGAEPWSMDPWTMDPWTRTMTSAFRFWLSLWPVAPFFGVEWRFADMAEKVDPKTGAAAKDVTELAAAVGTAPVVAAAETAAAMTEAAVASVEEAVEVTEAVTTSAHEAVETAESAAKKAAPAAPSADRTDDLTRIKGIGPGVARQLDELGIRSFAQLAALTEAEMAAIDEKLNSIRGRCFRDDWIGQAKTLAG